MIQKFENIGDRISDKLSELKMSQKELSQITGLSTNAISQYVRNLRVPDTSSIYKIAQALNVSIEWLLVGNANSQNTSNENSAFILNNNAEIHMIEMFRTFNEDIKEDIFEIIKNKYDRQCKKGISQSFYSICIKENIAQDNSVNSKNQGNEIA